MKINFSNKNFYFFLIISISFHLIIAFFLILSKGLPILFKKEKNILIQSAIRVDTIGLPDLSSKTKAKAKKQKRKAISIQKEKKKEKKKSSKSKNQKKENNKIAKNQKNIKAPTPQKEDKLNKGNKLSEGTKDGKENINPQQLSKITAYVNQMDSQIRSQWKLPKYLTNKNLTAQVEIKINNLGQIIHKQILISSGNELFDSFALKAIVNAEPYPEPSSEIQSFIKNGVVLSLSSD